MFQTRVGNALRDKLWSRLFVLTVKMQIASTVLIKGLNSVVNVQLVTFSILKENAWIVMIKVILSARSAQQWMILLCQQSAHLVQISIG